MICELHLMDFHQVGGIMVEYPTVAMVTINGYGYW